MSSLTGEVTADHNYRHIGILGGMPPAATADLLAQMMAEHDKRFGDEFYPDPTVRYANTGRVFKILDTEPFDKQALVAELTPYLGSLAKAGADFAVIAANTPHVVLGDLQERVDISIRSIVDATRDEAIRLKVARPLLLGTGITMSDGFFHRPLIDAGIEVVIPGEWDQRAIDRVITSGQFDNESRRVVTRAAKKYDCDSIILACTELPRLIIPDFISVPMLDTVDIQARDTLDIALR